MKNLLLFLVITVMFGLCADIVLSNDVLQFKQKIGQNYTMYWYHNSRHYGTEVLYNNKPYLLVGVGPAAQIVPVGPIKLKAYGYLALKSDLAKKHWPADIVQIDSYLVSSYEKNWSLSLRTWLDITAQDKKHPAYSGEYFLGYQLGERQIQVRTEWKYQDKLSQTIGLACSSKISTTLSLAGYLGLETKKPFGKSGWVAIKWVGEKN